MNIEQILSNGECSYIEYKQRWYWDLPKQQGINTQKCIGEFIKDFLSLVNSDEVSFFSQTRYLIIGYDEYKNDVYDFGLNDQHFDDIRKTIIKNIKTFISESSQLQYDIKQQKYKSVNLIVMSIFPPSQIHSLKKQIDTQTLTYQEGTCLYRSNLNNSNGKNDSVGVMPPAIIQNISNRINKNNKQKSVSDFKNKSIELIINSYLEMNNSKIISKVEKSDDSKNYFELYELNDEVDGSQSYFLYISDNSIKSTIDKFKVEHNTIPNQKITLLIDKPIKNKNPDKRKETFKNQLNIQYIYFLDEFGKRFLYQKNIKKFLFDDPLPNTKHFIEHQVSERGSPSQFLAQKLISNWFKEENQPAIVLLGEGGIGKTTLAKYFINNTFEVTTENYVLFLDSSTIIDKINNGNVNKIYDLYYASDKDNSFTEELFRLAIDNGNLTIVLDGLDEIISRMNDRFSLGHFLHNICHACCFNNAKTKIIITCRDSVWTDAFSRLDDSIRGELPIKEITLKPFDNDQAKRFFEKCFNNDEKKQKKSMNLIEQMNRSSTQKLYSPFALETIYSVVSDGVNSDLDSLFSSDQDEMKKLCFNLSSTTDYLIYAICKREYRKIGFSLNTQIKVLCELSKQNKISHNNFSKILTESIDESIEKEHSHLFLAHPFIIETNNCISLRYDFLKEFFSCLLISINITEENMDKHSFRIIKEKVSYLNNFSKDVSKRIHLDKDDVTLSIMSIINNEHLLDEECKSSLFLLYLTILKDKNYLQDQDDLNNALKDIFYDNKTDSIKDLSLYHITDDKKTPKLIFDFSDMVIDNAHIENYSLLGACTFNDGTIFRRGSIKSSGNPSLKYNFVRKNFDHSVQLDEMMKNILDDIEQKSTNKTRNTENILINFIKKFYNNGRFKPQKQTYIRSSQGQYVERMLELKVIVEYKDSKINEKEFAINTEYNADFINFLNNGVPNKIILELIHHFNSL